MWRKTEFNRVSTLTKKKVSHAQSSHLSPDNPGGSAESAVVQNFDVDLTNPVFNAAFVAGVISSDNSSNFISQDFTIDDFMELPEKEKSKQSHEDVHQMPTLARRLPETNTAANML